MLPISRQEKIDRIMCKPGYTWNETVGRCLMGGFIREGDMPDKPKPPKPGKPEQPALPNPNDAVKQEKAMRAATPKAVK